MSESSVVVITGANRGIGLELARHYAGEGHEVIGVCRQSSDELASVAAQVIEEVDVTTNEGIEKLKAGLAGKRISLLINNAGLLQDEQLGSIDFDSIRMGSIADNDSGGRYGYRASKAALNAFGKSLAMDLKPKGIAVAQLHPGYVKTRMVGFGGLISPEDSARGLAERIAKLSLENTGSFWHSNGEELPW